ncbi:unnamed protein product [Bursaphelenchus xylophilus]|uniref:(pine wood nematode) hypothetical protein n=1 Tax=Bursaphelenchus xylophilus TaxID=6326 RepID=A0A1I7SA05_BURXY|nr:unnamed protein product [Bursaphelenchus xylophilus]CAG9126086.1 unnamed protein product [Bursaphelenchus xylophilus]
MQSAPSRINAKRRMSGPIVGGYTEQDPNSPDIKPWVEKAVHNYNKQSNHANLHRLVKVHSVHTQVVAGTNYKIKLDVGETNKKNNSDEKLVGDEEVSNVKTITATVFHQPWTNTEEYKFDNLL